MRWRRRTLLFGLSERQWAVVLIKRRGVLTEGEDDEVNPASLSCKAIPYHQDDRENEDGYIDDDLRYRNVSSLVKLRHRLGG